MKKYRFYTACGLRATDNARTISGHAILWDVRSVLLPDWEHGSVYEVVSRGAVHPELLASCDVVANINHDDDKMLARSVHGAGSLRMEVDDAGLLVSFEAADTIWGNYALESVRRGDFSGMSFCFSCDAKDIRYTEEAGEDGKKTYIRHIDKIQGLYDVSVVTHPAYPDTDVSARSASVRSALQTAGLIQPEEAPAPLVRSDFEAIGAWLRRSR